MFNINITLDTCKLINIWIYKEGLGFCVLNIKCYYPNYIVVKIIIVYIL